MWDERCLSLEIWRALLARFYQRKQLNGREAFVDRSVSPPISCQPLTTPSERTEVDSGDGPTGVPLRVSLDVAQPAVANLLDATSATIAVPRVGPGRLRPKLGLKIADKAYNGTCCRPLARSVETLS